MTWENFYLATFLIGFLLSAISFFAGTVHMPHFHGHGHAHGIGRLGKIGKIGGKGGVSPFNFGTFAAFLCWFGGTGYLLERYSNVWIYLALGISMMSGLGGAAVIFWFLWKLNAQEAPLDPADYDMIGVLGQIASPIRGKGTGELIYSRAGSRRCSPARSEDGAEIPRGTEVVVTRFEKGIVYVRRWDELNGERI
jgi:membrane protein implicated in regulation of membrane protease activity